MQLKIEKLSTDGNGIARTDNGIVFVKGALPDEIAEVEIVTRKREYSVAKAVSIIEPSKYRTNPVCPYFSNITSRVRCGGCQIQHSMYPYQLELKAGFIEEHQCYKCKKCTYHYIVAQKSDVKSQEVRRLALEMYLEDMGFRAIGHVLQISYETVYK
jgi:tRNA/tmRNA/rRNA uracil-C5-methylase (TrmA/RlmC/RlmD family)